MHSPPRPSINKDRAPIDVARIKREAAEAVREGLTLVEGCPYPFSSTEADEFCKAFESARGATEQTP
jgi:hypothetical protein